MASASTQSTYDLVMWRQGNDFRPLRQQPEWVFSVPDLSDADLTHQIVSSVIDGLYAAEKALKGSPYTLYLTIREPGHGPEMVEVEELRRFAVSKGVHQVFGHLRDMVPQYLHERNLDRWLAGESAVAEGMTEAALKLA
ncbi:hypothetical protein [Marinobacterium sp. BA1]|uniref:hypothetical protein n=1 Tax=Marinobacterium sp. BA1 TaxID=3138931 RepID=UPI0034E859A2